jgi:excisionase family DNA binding protein
MSARQHQESPDHSLSIDEAAARLGVSPVTIRRRIKTGEIGAVKRPTAYGFEWRILLDSDGESTVVSTSAAQPVISPALNADHDDMMSPHRK